jgi:hypothetical protein
MGLPDANHDPQYDVSLTIRIAGSCCWFSQERAFLIGDVLPVNSCLMADEPFRMVHLAKTHLTTATSLPREMFGGSPISKPSHFHTLLETSRTLK